MKIHHKNISEERHAQIRTGCRKSDYLEKEISVTKFSTELYIHLLIILIKCYLRELRGLHVVADSQFPYHLSGCSRN